MLRTSNCTAISNCVSSAATTTITVICLLYVFCGDAMLACYLRRSRIDGAKNTTALIKLLVQRLRTSRPDPEIIVRADSGFCRLRRIRWCERNGVGYVIGVARNPRLQAIVALTELAMAEGGLKKSRNTSAERQR